MLDLGSDRWSELHDAFGPATGVPALLRRLPTAPIRADWQEQPWFDLWSRLSHQGDVYSASYAALPHIISAAQKRTPREQAEYLVLAGSIEEGRHRPQAPQVPTDLDESYREAVSIALELALAAIRLEGSSEWIGGLLQALAAFKGEPRLAAAIAALEPTIICPKCDAAFTTPGFDAF